MKKILLYLLVPFIAFLVSCGGDEEIPPHIVGTWTLKEYAIINLPSDYASNEGRTYELDEITLGIEEMEIIVSNDGTYSRTIKSSGSLPDTDSGTWTISTDGEDFTLDSDDFDDDEEFGVEKNETDDLWISFPITFGLISDSTIDQLFTDHGDSAGVNAYLATLTNEEYQALFDSPLVDLVFVMERDS